MRRKARWHEADRLASGMQSNQGLATVLRNTAGLLVTYDTPSY